MLILKSANFEDIEKEWLFQRDIPVDENGFLNDYHDISRNDFDTALETIIAQSNGENLPEGYVPQTIYYLWDDDNIVGTFHFRHYLCQSLIEGSGHVGYYIAPEYRGKGYATACLNYAKELAVKADCYKMMLLTGSKSESTLNLYKQAGYNCTDKTAFIQWL